MKGEWRLAKIFENNFGQLTIRTEGKEEIQIQIWEDNEKIKKVYENEMIGLISPVLSDVSHSDDSHSR